MSPCSVFFASLLKIFAIFFSLAHGLNAAALLDKANAEKFLNRIEDIVGQADDVDGKYLQVLFS